VLAGLAGCAASEQGGPLPPAVAAVQSYLDGLRSLTARFVQTGPDGSESAGRVWYQPGCLRLEYDPPGSLVVVARDGRLVAHRASDGSTTRIALQANPLGLLLVPHLRLSGTIEVTDVQRTSGLLQVSLARRANPAQGLLTLLFAAPGDAPVGPQDGASLALLSLQAVDARGQRTVLHLERAQTGVALPAGLFAYPAG